MVVIVVVTEYVVFVLDAVIEEFVVAVVEGVVEDEGAVVIEVVRAEVVPEFTVVPLPIHWHSVQ